MYPSVNRPVRRPSYLSPRLSSRPLSGLARSPLAMSPRPLSGMRSPMAMSPRPLSGMRSPMRSPMAMSPFPSSMMESNGNMGMIMDVVIGVLGVIGIALGIYYLSSNPHIDPADIASLSFEEADKKKKNRNIMGGILLGVGILMFLGLAGKWMNSRGMLGMRMM